MPLLATLPQPELLVDHIVPDDLVRRQVGPSGRILSSRFAARAARRPEVSLSALDLFNAGAKRQALGRIGGRGGQASFGARLGFYHQQPLPYRHMIASLQGHDARWLGFLVDITWCRFTQHGWYDSGGRFLQGVASPVPNLRARQAQ